MYPSALQLLIPAMQNAFPDVHVLTELPTYAEGEMATNGWSAIVQLHRFGGGVPFVTMARHFIDADAWAPTLAAADLVAQQVTDWVLNTLPGTSATSDTGSGTFSRTEVISLPSERPAGNADLRRVGMSFAVMIHSAR